MILTPIYKFKKRELTDSPPDITANNSNWDVLETNLKSHADSIASQSKQIDVLNDYFGIDGMVTVTGDANDLRQGNCVGENLKNAPVQSGWLEYNTSVWFRGFTEYKTQVAKDIVGNQWYRVRNNGIWTGWEDKIGNLLNKKPICGFLDHVTDFNNCLTQGEYMFSSEIPMPNCPPIWKVGGGYGKVIVTVSDGGTHDNAYNWVWQTVYSTNVNFGVWKRQKINSSAWSEWQQMATTDKINISFPFNSGYEQYNDNFKSMLVINTSLRVCRFYFSCKKTDGSSLSSILQVGNIPASYVPIFGVSTRISSPTTSDGEFTVYTNGQVLINLGSTSAPNVFCNVEWDY